jgi:hypothetical protein
MHLCLYSSLVHDSRSFSRKRACVCVLVYSVADPHHFDPDPDPTFHSDPDPDPTFQFDPDPDPAFQITHTKLKK